MKIYVFWILKFPDVECLDVERTQVIVSRQNDTFGSEIRGSMRGLRKSLVIFDVTGVF